jgi:uncharacterized delta-60 repeat protein
MNSSTPITPQKSSFLSGGYSKYILGKDQRKFHLRLAFFVVPAFIILLLNFPFSGGVALAPDWVPVAAPILGQEAVSHGLLDSLSRVFIPSSSASPSADSNIYLPLLVNQFPTIPTAPVLNAISNADGDGSYTVSWSSSTGVQTYTLQEDDQSAFSSPVTAYEGPATSKVISGKDVGTYYYRVMASNDYASSEWSNIQSVAVSVSPPPCPQTGSWRGNTSQARSIEFIVEDSPECQIAAGSLKISYSVTMCGSGTVTFSSAFPIIDNTFSVSSPWIDASGEFTAADLALGTLTVDYWSGGTRCYYTGSWEAYPVVGANGPVYDLLVQTDHKILVGGNFSEVGRQPHHNLARLNPDGSVDSAFNPNFNSSVHALAIQTNGKILAGGSFSQVDGAAHAGIARLNPDGSLDTGFNAQIDGNVSVLALQSDGKILVGGWFSAVNEQSRSSLARLNSNGELDETFNVESSYMDLYALEVQPDDKILLGGYIEDVSGVEWADYFVRLNPGGTLDTSFQADTGGWWVDGITLQTDGKVIAAIYGGPVRFNTNGSRDTSFNPPVPLGGYIRHVVIQSDGALVGGGDFVELDDNPIQYLAQLDPTGTLNLAFNPAPNGEIYALAVQSDDKILVGGGFSTINGQVRTSITRLNPDGSLDETFVVGP